MNISSNSVLAKIYQFAELFVAATGDRHPNPYNTTNTCTFIRMIVFWLPVCVLLQLTWVSAILITFVVLPFAAFGPGYAAFWIGVVICLLIILGIKYSAEFVAKKYPRSERRHFERKPNKLWELIKEHYKGFKGKYCPIITFEDEENHVQ